MSNLDEREEKPDLGNGRNQLDADRDVSRSVRSVDNQYQQHSNQLVSNLPLAETQIKELQMSNLNEWEQKPDLGNGRNQPDTEINVSQNIRPIDYHYQQFLNQLEQNKAVREEVQKAKRGKDDEDDDEQASEDDEDAVVMELMQIHQQATSSQAGVDKSVENTVRMDDFLPQARSDSNSFSQQNSQLLMIKNNYDAHALTPFPVDNNVTQFPFVLPGGLDNTETTMFSHGAGQNTAPSSSSDVNTLGVVRNDPLQALTPTSFTIFNTQQPSSSTTVHSFSSSYLDMIDLLNSTEGKPTYPYQMDVPAINDVLQVNENTPDIFRCRVCQQRFPSLDVFCAHKLEHYFDMQRYTCELCSNIFRRDDCAFHMMTHHEATSSDSCNHSEASMCMKNQLYQCNICFKVLKRTTFEAHVLGEHTKAVNLIKRKNNIQNSEMKELVVQKFRVTPGYYCSECRRLLDPRVDQGTTDSMHIHMCTCGFTTRSIHKLQRHRSSVHQPPYKCFCGFTCKDLGDVIKHADDHYILHPD